MRLLVMDTTGVACSVALRVPGRDDLILSDAMTRGQAERLAPMTREILETANLNPADVDRIGVTTGPGSFAGTRIGVAFARGLSLATGAECVGVSCLQWWASNRDPDLGRDVLAVHDSRRGELVIQDFSNGKPLDGPRTLPVDDVRALLTQRLKNGAPVEMLNLVGSGARLVFPVETDSAEEIAPDLVGLLDLVSSLEPPFDRPRPFYARPPDAKLPKDVGL